MKKQNIAIIGVIAFVLAVAVGYALFTDVITINGTATAKGNFDMEITSATVAKEVGSEGATAEISADKDTLTITVPQLEYPGAYVEIPVKVTNVGSITAVLESIEQTGMTESSPVKITYTGPAASDDEIAATESQDMTIKVEWLAEDGSETMSNEDNSTEVTANFSVVLNYKQIQAQ